MAKQPPPLIQRKSKLETNVRNILNEQKSKLQQKQQLDHELLEDIKNYSKIRATIERDYGQALQKLAGQFISKFTPKENEDENKPISRTPFGLWRMILNETDKTATSRLALSQSMMANVTESIKSVKAARAVTTKNCNLLAEKLQEELQESVQELARSEKSYIDIFKATKQVRDQVEDANDKIKKGQFKLFQTKSNAEKKAQKMQERRTSYEKRLTTNRNDYIMNLAAANAHHQRYYSTDLPELIALQDGNIYEKFKDYFKTLTTLEIDACSRSEEGMRVSREEASQLQRAYAMQLFLRINPVFTQCLNHDFQGCRGDKLRTISQEQSATHHLNKEARKWALRLAKAQKSIRTKSSQLQGLECDQASLAEDTTESDNKDSIIEEIRHSEIIRIKAEARLDILKEAGINVDEWLQSASADNGDDEDNNNAQENDESDLEDFCDDWEEDEIVGDGDFSDDDVSSSSTQSHKIFSAVAIYSFQAASREELSIVENEEIEIIETDVDGWCKGRNKNGQCGYLPEAYVEIIKTEATRNRSEASSNSGSTSSGKKPCIAPKPVISVVPTEPEGLFFAKALYSYNAVEEEELSFKEGDTIKVTSTDNNGVDDGWWEGFLNGRKGAFPSIVVERIQTSQQSKNQNELYERRRINTDSFAAMPKGKNRRLLDRRISET